jgi:transmembrane sensor
MNTERHDQHSTRTIRAEAAEWFARMQNPKCTQETRTACDQWCNADSRHGLAYEQCRTLWLMTRELKSDPDITRELATARSQHATTSYGFGARKRWHMLGIAATFLVVTVAAFLKFSLTSEEYTTRVAEHRVIQLPDGSTAMLNTDSSIRVHFTGSKRAIELKKGEAYFSVSKDPKRPFEVTAASSVVRAVGTEFNVALLNRRISVDVTEGVVEFKAPASTDAQLNTHVLSTHIKEGEAISFHKGDTTLNLQPANTARISAWQARKIYFSENTLEDAVAEYNRYSKEKIIIINDELKNQKISGIFNVDDIDAFTFSLEQLLELRVERHQGNVLVMKK